MFTTFITRMHSSRMRTICWSSRVCPGSVCPGGCLPRGVCLPRGCLPSRSRGVSARHPPWTEFVTHACENITFPQLHLRTVIISIAVMFANYRPQRSCGQGYVFTCVCDSVHGGAIPACIAGGIPACLAAGWGGYPSMNCRWHPSMPFSMSLGGAWSWGGACSRGSACSWGVAFWFGGLLV